MNTWGPVVWIVAAGGAVYALHLLWKHAITPIWRSLVSLVHFAEALPVLLCMAEEFKPNEGSSLRDQIDLVNMRLENIEQQLETICIDEVS